MKISKDDLIDEEKVQEPIKIHRSGSWPKSWHLFDEKSIWAINAALSAERPLLVRGEPGLGKSQLARAAAQVLGRAFICEVVHARSECQDLQWCFDTVARLGEAQALVACSGKTEVKAALNPLRFLKPGALWWALNWQSALKHVTKYEIGLEPEKPKGWKNQKGCVLLIDEIDKADADLPNGLLETLGNGAFTVPHLAKAIQIPEDVLPPLVIITTNEERELPAAFLRRCMVLQMKLPKEEEYLVKLGKIHFGTKCSDKVYQEAAKQLWTDRRDALDQKLPAPGQAEYIDMLRALSRMDDSEEKQLQNLEKISEFALKKYPDEE